MGQVMPKRSWERDFLGRPHDQASHRQDVVFGDLPDEDAVWIGPLELPALGYATLPLERLPIPEGELAANENSIGNGRLIVTFDRVRGGVRSLRLDGIEHADSDGLWTLGLPVLERPTGGHRTHLYGPPDFDRPDMHQAWHPDWEALREGPSELLDTSFASHAGCAEYRQAMRMASGDKVVTCYRLFPDEPSLELEVRVDKAALRDPHALYLSLPLDLGGEPSCHFETAGAVVELDREQLPYASRHFLTTQRWLRLQGEERGITVACPDAPLWQVGGFTFGRHREGKVDRTESLLAAWLTNNYWDTNFQADQSGPIRFRFRLLPHLSRPLEQSIREVLPFVVPPSLHLYRSHGPRKYTQAHLLELDMGGALVTGMVGDDMGGVSLYLLNPTDDLLSVTIGPGVVTPRAAWHMNLAGNLGDPIMCVEGRVALELPARVWTGVHME